MQHLNILLSKDLNNINLQKKKLEGFFVLIDSLHPINNLSVM